MKEPLAVLLALLAASVVPPVLMSLVWLPGRWRLHEIVGSIIVLYPYSAAAVLVLGLPTFLLLRPFGRGHWWSVAAIGFLMGVLVDVVMRLPGRPNPPDFLVTGPVGLAAALAFWIVWRRCVERANPTGV